MFMLGCNQIYFDGIWSSRKPVNTLGKKETHKQNVYKKQGSQKHVTYIVMEWVFLETFVELIEVSETWKYFWIFQQSAAEVFVGTVTEETEKRANCANIFAITLGAGANF